MSIGPFEVWGFPSVRRPGMVGYLPSGCGRRYENLFGIGVPIIPCGGDGGCSTVSPPVSLFIFTVFCGRKYPSRTQWLENATISFCCELLSSLMNAVKDH